MIPNPEPHQLHRSSDPESCREEWAEPVSGKKFSDTALEALRHITESPGMTQNEHDRDYPAEIHRYFTKTFNWLLKHGYVESVRTERTRKDEVSGRRNTRWYPTEKGLAELRKR